MQKSVIEMLNFYQIFHNHSIFAQSDGRSSTSQEPKGMFYILRTNN